MALADFNHIKAVIAELDIQRPSRFGFTESAVSSTGQAEIDALTGEYIIDDGSQINSIPAADMVGFDPIIIDIGLRTQAATVPRMAFNHFFGRLSLNLLKLTDKLNLLVRDHLVNRYITPSGNVTEHITVSPQTDSVQLIQHQSPLAASEPVTASAAISIPAAADAGNAGVMTGTDKKNLEDLLSRDKTIAGVKTFSEIPVLPASNPILDNHAVRNAWLAQLDAQNVKLSGAQSIDGVKTFNAIPAFNGGESGVSAPFTVDSTTVVANLNADLLDGYHESSFFKLANNETVTGRPAFNGGTSGSSSPFTVDSTQVVTNLNADLLDGRHVGTSGNVVPLLDGANTISGIQTLTANPVISNAAPAITFQDTTSSAYDFRIQADGNVMSLRIDTGSDGTFETINPLSSVYTGSAHDNTNYPIGTCVFVISSDGEINRNASEAIEYFTGQNYGFGTHSGTGATLSGTWRARGCILGTGIIFQRTA